MPGHWGTAFGAFHSIPNEHDRLALSQYCVFLPSGFARRCSFKCIFINDGIVIAAAEVRAVLYNPCDPRFIPRIGFFGVGDASLGQYISNVFQGGSSYIFREYLSDNFCLPMINYRMTITNCVSVWDKAILLHGITPK